MKIDILQFQAIYNEGWRSCHKKYTKDLVAFIEYANAHSKNDKEFRMGMMNVTKEKPLLIRICGYTRSEVNKYFKFCEEYHEENNSNI